MEQDFALTHAMMGVLGALPKLRKMPFTAMHKQVGSAILRQLDFPAEAAALSELGANLSELANVRVPRLLPDLCRPEVVVMEYIDDLRRFEAHDLDAEARREMVRAVLTAVYEMLFIDGVGWISRPRRLRFSGAATCRVPVEPTQGSHKTAISRHRESVKAASVKDGTALICPTSSRSSRTDVRLTISRKGKIVPVEGFWNVEIKTPLGVRQTVIEFSVADGKLHGTSRSDAEELTLFDLQQDGDRLSWHQNVTKPMRLTLYVDVAVDGHQMTGTARGGPMRSAKVTGSRASAPQVS